MKHPITDSLGRNQEIWFINESGVYDLIFGSKLESAKLNNKMLSSIGQRGSWIINESGLYSLVLSNKLPSIIFGMSFNL